MKFESALATTGSVEDVSFFASISSTLKRVAPGAFAFVVPDAGSSKVVSVELSTIDSVVVRPILNVGVLLYLLRTSVCGKTKTKNHS